MWSPRIVSLNFIVLFLQIAIHYGEKPVKFCLTKPGNDHIVIGQLIANLKINFPGGNLE
jgi:hypothetical protein